MLVSIIINSDQAKAYKDCKGCTYCCLRNSWLTVIPWGDFYALGVNGQPSSSGLHISVSRRDQSLQSLRTQYASGQIPIPQYLIPTTRCIVIIICIEIIWINDIKPFISIYVNLFKKPRLLFISQTHPVQLCHPFSDLISHFSPLPKTLPVSPLGQSSVKNPCVLNSFLYINFLTLGNLRLL